MVCFILSFVLLLAFSARSSAVESGGQSILVARVIKPYTSDFPDLKKKRLIRVLVSYSKTNFFPKAGEIKGFEHEMFLEYEKFLNKGITRKDFKIHVAYVPVPFEQLIPALIEGKGDIAAAGLTITPEREKLVAFTDPYLSGIDEIVVMSKTAKPLDSIESLSGRKVYVPESSSYADHIKALNKAFAEKGIKPVEVISPSPYFETEDLLELINAGVFDITVADSHVAELWSSVFADIVLRPDLKINEGGKIAYAVRKNNPELLANLNEFVKENKKGTLIGNILFKDYYKNTKWIKNPIIAEELKKIERYKGLFQKYAEKFDFDWLFLAAQSYQESSLNHSTVSSAGAVGLMQIMPVVSKDMGIPNVQNEENNVHAGAKYMAFLRDKFFNEPEIPREVKWDFTLAAYNAGPNRVVRWRKEAKNMGLDQNKWFFNVERVALRDVGQETVRYVAQINMYYVAYKMGYSLIEGKAKDKEKSEGK